MRTARVVPLLAFVCALACSGAPSTPAPAPSPPPEPTAPPRKARKKSQPPPRAELAPWQEPFAKDPTKNVRDYVMLLPDDIFGCDVPAVTPRDEAQRDSIMKNASLSDGYLEMNGDNVYLAVALYEDHAGQRDVIGLVNNAGIGDMCNIVRFQVFDPAQGWTDAGVLPEEEIDTLVKERGGEFWWPKLPKKGTTTEIVDEDGKVLLSLKWEGGKFSVIP